MIFNTPIPINCYRVDTNEKYPLETGCPVLLHVINSEGHPKVVTCGLEGFEGEILVSALTLDEAFFKVERKLVDVCNLVPSINAGQVQKKGYIMELSLYNEKDRTYSFQVSKQCDEPLTKNSLEALLQSCQAVHRRAIGYLAEKRSPQNMGFNAYVYSEVRAGQMSLDDFETVMKTGKI